MDGDAENELDRWLSGQKQRAVNPSPIGLRRFESFPVHHLSISRAVVAQLVERVLGKDEVTSSILVIGSSLRSALARPSVGSASQQAKDVAPTLRSSEGGRNIFG
jgi:hypothetical protein